MTCTSFKFFENSIFTAKLLSDSAQILDSTLFTSLLLHMVTGFEKLDFNSVFGLFKLEVV